MQGFGTLLCSLVLLIITHSMGSDYNSQWRLSLALGSVPMIFAFYFRWIMHETSWKDEVPMVGLKYIDK
jgi:hypothetical protein